MFVDVAFKPPIIFTSHMSLPAESESSEGRVPNDPQLQTVLEAYEASLVVPASKRSPQILLCPVGLVGAGKTTVVKPLSSRLGLVRISTDEIRERFKALGFGYTRTMEIAVPLIRKYLMSGDSVTIDADCVGSAEELAKSLEERASVSCVWIHIDPPESFILNKFRTMTYLPTGVFTNEAQARDNYFRRKSLHEHLDMPFVYTLDTSRADIATQIEEAARLIETKG